MNKKFLKFASLSALAFLPFSVSANNEAKLEAEKYIKLTFTFDLFWKWKKTHISWEKYFYSADERKPSYIEYKVSCDKQVDCWYVMVNIDWTDSSIPEASSVWKTSSEIMSEMSCLNKLYKWMVMFFLYSLL